MGIFNYFDEVLVTENLLSKDELLKDAMEDNVVKRSDTDMVVSDMGKDILVSKKLGFRTIAITHGFMSREKLFEYNPDWIVENLSEIPVIVKELIESND